MTEVSLEPKFYKKYADDIFPRRKVNMHEILLEGLNNYPPKTKLSIKLNQKNFLYTRLICVDGICNTTCNSKSTKLPIACLSK